MINSLIQTVVFKGGVYDGKTAKVAFSLPFTCQARSDKLMNAIDTRYRTQAPKSFFCAFYALRVSTGLGAFKI